MNEHGFQYQLTLRMFLDSGMNYAPNQIIKYRDELQFTYTEHYSRTKKLCNGLKTLGLKPKEAVAMLDWDTHRYLEAHWAIPLSGCLFHTVNVRMSPEQIEYCINNAEDKVIFVNEEFLPLIESMKDRIKTVKAFVYMTDKKDKTIPETTLSPIYEYEALLEAESDDFEFPDISENTKAALCYTSGTTGSPKGVVFTHRELVMHAIAVCLQWGIFPPLNFHAGQVYMPLTPLFHVQGWGVPYFAFMMGCKYILPGKYEPDKLLKWIDEEKVDVSHCVTTILHMLVFHPDVEKYDLSNWRVGLGGAKQTRQLGERAWELGIKTISCYGMTETCPAMSLGQPKVDMNGSDFGNQIDHTIRSGIPWVFSRMQVVDANQEPVPKDGKTTGAIQVRTPWCTHEYLNDEENTSQLWENNWLNTGDVGFIDDEGYLMVTDRVKDAIKSGGEWISTLIIEDAISMHPAILECATIGIPDTKWDERPCACMVLKPGHTVTAEEIKKHLLKYSDTGKIEKWWIPDIPNGYRFLDEIPHNFVGKINKVALREEIKSL
jgi:fatty-acyl-CoA synthase